MPLVVVTAFDLPLTGVPGIELPEMQVPVMEVTGTEEPMTGVPCCDLVV